MAGARTITIILAFVATLIGGPVAANLPSNQADGWHTWQVDEAGATSEMCCFTWEHGKSSRNGCDLDGRNMSFSDRGDCAAAPGQLQVYVRFEDGKPADIRALSSNCPVSAESEIADHGHLSAAENLAWFRAVIENRKLRKQLREEALFALAMSESDAAYDYFDQLLSRR